jgi:hypothetical protein
MVMTGRSILRFDNGEEQDRLWGKRDICRQPFGLAARLSKACFWRLIKIALAKRIA